MRPYPLINKFTELRYIVSCFLKAGVLLRKYEHFRELLEENALQLTDRRHMSDLIPFILSEELQRIKSDDISSKYMYLLFLTAPPV